MHNIQYYINRTKKQLANDGKYYSCMGNIEFEFRCNSNMSSIIISTNDKQYFKERFDMKDSGSSLILVGNNNDGSWGKYFNLYYNALIVMLEQSLNDPRPIIRELTGSLSYHHNPKNVDDNLDRILYNGSIINSIMLGGDDKIGTGTLEEYCNMVKKLWDGSNSAYNVFLYKQVLLFDTYPAY